VRFISRIEDRLTMSQDGLSLSEMDHGGGEQADAGVVVLFVVLEELVGRRRGCAECSRNDRGTPADTSWCGIDFPSTGCRRKK
jgi:hypothetical protein